MCEMDEDMLDLICPTCGSKTEIEVYGSVWVRAHICDGYVAISDETSKVVWSKNSEASCMECGWSGILSDAIVTLPAPDGCLTVNAGKEA